MLLGDVVNDLALTCVCLWNKIYVMLCYAMLCYAVLCCAVLCCVVLCCVVLCCVVLCCVVLFYVMLCYVMLCYVMLCYFMLYWFPSMRTGSRHGPWNSLHLYHSETIGVSASLDSAIGTGFYKLLWVLAISYTLRISKLYVPTLINHRNNSTTAPISLDFVPVSSWGSLPQCYF